MKLVSLLTLGAAAAGGFAGARALLRRDEAPQGLPEPVQKRVDRVHGRLVRLRERAADALAAGREERDLAERELHAAYLARTGRTTSSIAPGTAKPR